MSAGSRLVRASSVIRKAATVPSSTYRESSANGQAQRQEPGDDAGEDEPSTQ